MTPEGLDGWIKCQEIGYGYQGQDKIAMADVFKSIFFYEIEIWLTRQNLTQSVWNMPTPPTPPPSTDRAQKNITVDQMDQWTHEEVERGILGFGRKENLKTECPRRLKKEA